MELQLLKRPLCCDHLQLCLNVLLFQGRDANILDVLFVWQQGRLHDVPQGQILPLQIKLVVCQALGGEFTLGNSCFVSGGHLDPLPMAGLHRFVAHELKERADFIEVVDGLLQGKEGRPLLQGLWKFSAPVKRKADTHFLQNTIPPVAEIHQLVVDVLNINFLPQDGEVPIDAVDHVVVELVEPLQQVQFLLDQVQSSLLNGDDYIVFDDNENTCSVCSSPKSSSPTLYDVCFAQRASNVF